MKDQLLSHLYVSFEAQMKSLRISVNKDFTESIKKLFPKNLVDDDFNSKVTKLKDRLLGGYKKTAYSYVVEESGWDEIVSTHEKDLI
jgi:hypothetical protein